MNGKRQITRFGLIRHAETGWNLIKRIQGQTDTVLTARGREQARTWTDRLGTITWHRILTSDLGRAMETAQLVNRHWNLPIRAESGLREQNWGDWIGRTLKTISREEPDELARAEAAGWGFRPPGGEDRHEVWNRSQAALLAAARQWPGENILVVTHEGVIKCLIYRLCGRLFLPSEPKLIKPEYLHWLAQEQDELRLAEVNAMSLSGAGESR
jgi:probable phosphoglycerate mutase